VASVRYRIQVSCPRFGVDCEWFVEFRQNALGQTNLHTEKELSQAHLFAGTWASESARDHLRQIRKNYAPIIAILFDEFGNIVDDHNTAPERPLNLYNSHETVIHRRRLADGQLIEAELVHNKSLKKYYVRFSTNPDPSVPGFDQSISGDSPDAALERFWNSPTVPDFVKERYIIDDSFLHQQQAEPVVLPGAPMAQLPDGTRISVRLTS